MTSAVDAAAGRNAAGPRSGPAGSDGAIGVGYRPHLDGLRAVAVYLVVAFHAGVDRASGGFIGVDVFFVLSGYLVTQLLVRDVRDHGSLDLLRFYGRRVRRLLPAAAVVLVVTMVVFSSVGSPAEILDARHAVRAAALYVANWFFISQSSQYFGADINASPVLHFWSLSVEEQFYVAWPLLFAGVHRAARRAGARRWAVVRGVCAVGMATSLVAALWLARTDLNRAYYGTDTRAYQLLAGALIALSPGALEHLRARSVTGRGLRATSVLALAGLFVLGSSLIHVDPVERGTLTAVLTVALIAAIETAPSGLVGRLLSLPPVVYLGRISYGTYLWHWIVIIVTVRVIDASPLSTALLAVSLATALAALSHELLERPIREARVLDRRRRSVVAAGLALSLVVGLLVVPTALHVDRARAESAVAQGTAVGSTPVPDDLDWRGAQDDTADFPECTAEAPERCTLVRGTGPHLLLIGDSHARMYIPMLTALAEQRHLTFSAAVAPACPWQQGLHYLQDQQSCQAHQADLYPTVLEQLDPDVVVVADRTFDDPASPIHVIDEAIGEELPLGSAPYLESIEARTAATLATLSEGGRKVVIIEPVPVAPFGTDPLECLSAATYLDECRFVSNREPTPVEQIYRRLAGAADQIWTLDLDARVCPYMPICDPIVGGLIVRRDTSHLTTRFAITLEEPVERFLDDNLILG